MSVFDLSDIRGPVAATLTALTLLEGAPHEKLAVGKMDERKFPVGFEKRNVLGSHHRTFHIVSQENEIVTIKYGRFAFPAFCSARRRLCFPDND
jgi:hypothetical protein